MLQVDVFIDVQCTASLTQYEKIRSGRMTCKDLELKRCRSKCTELQDGTGAHDGVAFQQAKEANEHSGTASIVVRAPQLQGLAEAPEISDLQHDGRKVAMAVGRGSKCSTTSNTTCNDGEICQQEYY